MTWLNDLTDARYDLMTVDKQHRMLPMSNNFTLFPINEVLRVFQLDALSVQQEIVNILQNCVLSIFDIKPLETVRFLYQEEFVLLLQGIIFYFSTWRSGQSLGDRMHNLVLRDETRAHVYNLATITTLHHTLAPHHRLLAIYATLTLVVPYVFRKIYRKLLEESYQNVNSTNVRSMKWYVQKLMHYTSIMWSALSFMNSLHFLITGKYRSLIERLLSLKVVYGSQKMERLTNLAFLNQHMMWQTWMSLLSCLRIARYLTRFVQSLQQAVIPTQESLINIHSSNLCSACHKQLTLSQRANCGHLYCYYCIKSRLIECQASGSFRCYQCGHAIYSCTPEELKETSQIKE